MCPICHENEMEETEMAFDKSNGFVDVELTCPVSTCDTKFIGTLYQTAKGEFE